MESNIGTVGDTKARRRRGEALESAILDAAWAELADGGYSQFTIEGVVRRAGTSRPVLYRRWPTRTSLAAAAISRYYRQNVVTVPDLGNVRDELFLFVRKYAELAPPRLMRLLFDMSSDMAAENMNFGEDRFRVYPLKAVIDRAIERGEIDPQRITKRVMGLPLTLALHEIIVTMRVISDEAIAEIIDQIFLPLVSVQRPKPRRADSRL
jgi:AcrR family transcriptional regulator